MKEKKRAEGEQNNNGVKPDLSPEM